MKIANFAEVRPLDSQAYSEPTPLQHPGSQNSLKHGLRSSAILLPSDDAEEFQRLRPDLFQTYVPRTGDEAVCGESIAGLQWRIARCRRWKAAFDAQLTGDPGELAGHICEPGPHRWMHRSMDCVLQESRLDRLMNKARGKLLLPQKLRRDNPIAGVRDATQGPAAWGGRSESAVSARASEEVQAMCSSDGEIGKCDEGISRHLDEAARSRRAEPVEGNGTARDFPAGADGRLPRRLRRGRRAARPHRTEPRGK